MSKKEREKNMGFVHKDSLPCAVSQFELFEVLPTCVQVEESDYADHYSISSLEGGTNVLEFTVQGSPNVFYDLQRTELVVMYRIRDGSTDMKVGWKMAPVANSIASLFTQCDVFLNNKLVTSSNGLYPYQAYASILMGKSRETCERQLSLQMLHLDKPGLHEVAVGNSGYEARMRRTKESRSVQISGPLYVDLFQQPKALLSGVDMRIRLTRSSDAFALIGENLKATDGSVSAHASNAHIEIQSARLKMWAMTLEGEAHLGIEKTLLEKNAIYNLQRVEMKMFNASAGDTEFTREHISLGLMPKYIVLFMVETDSQQGKLNRNPFNFKHFDLKQISLNIDGRQNPMNGLNTDYDSDKYAEVYKAILDVVGKSRSDVPFIVDYEEFKQGYNMFAFQLAPLLAAGAFNKQRNSNVRLDMKWAKALPANISIIAMFVRDGAIEISRLREVMHNFES